MPIKRINHDPRTKEQKKADDEIRKKYQPYCCRCGGGKEIRYVRIEPRCDADYPGIGYLCKPCRDQMRGGWRYVK